MPLIVNLIIFFGCLIAWIEGIYLGFQAGIVMGLVVLLIEPMPILVGLVYMLTPEHINLASVVGKALGLH